MRIAAASLVCLAALTCGAPTTPGSAPPYSFTVSPIAISAIENIVPLGNLNPPGHTLPTDHIYFYHHLLHPAAPAFEVVAPGDGEVKDIVQHGDQKVYVKATSAQTYYVDHLYLDGGIKSGTKLTAGQRLGVTSDKAFALDLGLVNSTVTVVFVNPARYIDQTIHTEMPLKYFSEPLKTSLYALVQRAGADKDGQISFDQAGRLAGNWFLEGLTTSESPNFEAGPKQISFARDVADPTQNRVSIGGTIAMQGVFALAGNAPDPATISTASGVVSFTLTGGGAGILLVQMLADDRIKAEGFPGAAPGTVAFTAGAQIYLR